MADDQQDDPSQQYEKHIQEASQKYGVHPDVIRALGDTESGWSRPDIVGVKDPDDRGLMQINARAHPEAMANWKDPRSNILDGTRIYRQGYDYLKQNGVPDEQLQDAALAAYNHGPGTVLQNFQNGRSFDTSKSGDDNGYSRTVKAKLLARNPSFFGRPSPAGAPVADSDNNTPPKDDEEEKDAAPTATVVSSPKVAAATDVPAPPPVSGPQASAAEARWGKVQNFDGKTLTAVKDGKTLAYDMTDPVVRKTLATSYGIPLPEDAKKDQSIGGMIRGGLSTLAGYENAALSGYADSGDHPFLTGLLNKYAPNRAVDAAANPTLYALGGGAEAAARPGSATLGMGPVGMLAQGVDGFNAADARNSIVGKDVTPATPPPQAPASADATAAGPGPGVPPPDSLMDGVAASDQANKDAIQATWDQAKAQVDQQNQIARERETQANMTQDAIRTTQDHYAAVQAAEEKRFDALMKAADELHQQAKINPNRLFASMSTGQRILGAVGQALSQIGGAIAGQKPVDLISEAIDRDVKAQEMSFRNLQHSYNATDNAYGALIKKGLTGVEAGHMLHALANEQAQQTTLAIAARSSSPIAQAQAAKLVTDLKQEQITHGKALQQLNSNLATDVVRRQGMQLGQAQSLFGAPSTDVSGKVSVQGQTFDLGPKAERVAGPIRQHLSAAEQVMNDLEQLKSLESETGSSFSLSDANKKIQELKQSIIANHNLALGKPGNGNGQRDPKKDPLWSLLEPSHWKGSASYANVLDAKKREIVQSLDNHFATVPTLPKYSDLIKSRTLASFGN